MSEHLCHGTVRGVVIDPSGAVIPHVAVRFWRRKEDFCADTMLDGSFEINLPSGEYKLLCKVSGFAQVERVFSLDHGEVHAESIHLIVPTLEGSINDEEWAEAFVWWLTLTEPVPRADAIKLLTERLRSRKEGKND